MFPVSDFDFVVAGIATFAATVGYVCTCRLSTSLSGPIQAPHVAAQLELLEKPSKILTSESCEPNMDMDMDSKPSHAAINQTPVRQESLKRKIPHNGFDNPNAEKLGYPHNLANIYPNKRSRTPSTDLNADNASSHSITPTNSLDSVMSTSDKDVVIPLVSLDPLPLVATPAPKPPCLPSPTPKEMSPQEPSPMPTPASPMSSTLRPTTPPPPAVAEPALSPSKPFVDQPILFSAVAGPTSQLICPSPAAVARPSTPNPFMSLLGDSTAFAGPTTPGPSTTRPSTPKPFMSPSGGFAAFAGSTLPFVSANKTQKPASKSSRSIWNSSKPAPGQFDESPEPNTANPLMPATKAKDQDHTIAEATSSFPTKQTTKYTYVTGEENEDVKLELKGIRLFVKRGDKLFLDGMYGHIKLLSSWETLDERILFHQEPLWKVSMNVRVQPTVRCTYLPEENVLQLALKPDRACLSQDFKDFAETLIHSAHFKSMSTHTSVKKHP
ncbi:hypothetical protein B0H34DRAFT_796541 [Crassisporium funariophilum]|nr:hypothetical protein B0H34DRAFT_796541 [Crassisporium funariophilum]